MKVHKKNDMVKRHTKLHRSLDELIGCFYIETGLMSGNVTLAEFMNWSYSMTHTPTCAEKENEVGQGTTD